MMKKAFIFFVLILGAALAYSQNGSSRPDLSETSVVKDSTGYQYPYIVWSKLFQSGRYGIKSKKVGNGREFEFLIYELSESQLAERMEKLPRPRETSNFKTGAKVVNFKMTDIKGNKYSLKDLQGKVVVLNFWFINCPPCRIEIPELNKLVTKYQNNPDVIFLAVALDDKYDLTKFLKSTPFIYNIIDDGRYYADQYGIKLYPTHLVINRGGLVSFHSNGLAQNTVYWVEKSIKEALERPSATLD